MIDDDGGELMKLMELYGKVLVVRGRGGEKCVWMCKEGDGC